LELVARESLTSLQAHRCTIFAPDEKSAGLLKTQFTFASDPLNEQVGVFEEKEVARKVFRQKKTFWLKGPGDFSEFFKYESRERKVTSLMSIPFWIQGRVTGTLSVVLVNSEKSFDEGSLQLLSIFANQISMAMENEYLRGELDKGVNFRKDYERYLDDILVQLQNLSQGEQRRIAEHIGSLFQPHKTDDGQSQELSAREGVDKVAESVDLTGEGDPRREEEEKELADDILRVVMEDGTLSLTDDLIGGGVFIRTPNPLDLGEQFPMKLYLSPDEAPLDITCKVIWTNKYGHETKGLQRGMGVKFLNLDPDVQKRVEESLQAQKLKWNESVAMEE
jgi:Tfp pilus assembly protein PilZ